MAANIYVYCPKDPDDKGPERDDLDDAILHFMGGAARNCGQGSGRGGFNLDYRLAPGEDPHAWADRLRPFLANFGVLRGTAFTVFPDGWQPGMEWRRVEVFGEDRRRTDDPAGGGRTRRST